VVTEPCSRENLLSEAGVIGRVMFKTAAGIPIRWISPAGQDQQRKTADVFLPVVENSALSRQASVTGAPGK